MCLLKATASALQRGLAAGHASVRCSAMGCGATSGRYREATVEYHDTAILAKTEAWHDTDQAEAEVRQPITAWADQCQDVVPTSDAWADPVQPIPAQVSLGGEWYFEAAPEAWYPFTPEISAQLLVAFYCGETHLEYLAGDTVFDVDFASCLQTDRSSGQQQRIGWVASSCQQAEASGQDLLESPQEQQQQPQQPVPEGSTDSQYEWIEYDEEQQQQLLAAWASGQTLIRYSYRGCDFEIDFTRMVETNLTTGDQRLLGVHITEEPDTGGGYPQPEVQDTPAGGGPSAAAAPPQPQQQQEKRPEPRRSAVSDGRFPIDTGQTGTGRVAGRPRTYVFKAAPDPGRQRREKKWSLAPGQKPRMAGKAQPPPRGQGGQQRPNAPGRAAAQPAAAPAALALPVGVEWPGDAKARRVAETLFRDMVGTKSATLEQRRQAYRAACLSWHPDKNRKHQALATAVFQFLQTLKAWYFGS